MELPFVTAWNHDWEDGFGFHDFPCINPGYETRVMVLAASMEDRNEDVVRHAQQFSFWPRVTPGTA